MGAVYCPGKVNLPARPADLNVTRRFRQLWPVEVTLVGDGHRPIAQRQLFQSVIAARGPGDPLLLPDVMSTSRGRCIPEPLIFSVKVSLRSCSPGPLSTGSQ